MKRLFLVVLILAVNVFAQKTSGPSVTISSPANGASFTAPASITITATASDTNATITVVKFFASGTIVGSVKTAPYQFTWTSVPAGNYTLTATATDNLGQTATSAAVNISVTSAATPDFSLGVSPATMSVAQGSSNATATVTSVNGFNSATNLSALGLPSGVTASFSAATVSPVAGGTASTTLTLSASSTATVGTSTVTITGTSGSITHSTSLSLIVTAVGQPPNYVGYVDHLGCDSIGGWAADRNRLNTSINVEIYDGTTLVQTVFANVSRPDVGTYLGDNGLHGYNIATPSRFLDGQAHQVHVKFETSTTELTNSPQSLTCTPTGTGTIQGYKIDGNGAVFNSPGATITIDGTQSFGPSVNPYGATVAAGSHTVTSSTPAGFTASYSLCNNCTDHSVAGGHPFVAGTSITVNVASGGYADLWWKYTGATDAPPTVTINSPLNGSSFTAPASVSIQATASDSDGTVSKVDFYASGLLIGTVTTPPYNFTWSNVAAGSYSLTAVATDNAGLTGSSSAVAITVVSAPVDFSTARLDPSNRTGLPGEDLLSGNYNWSLPLVSLKGRAGLDVDLALTYNHLSAWTKSGSSIEFDADRGFPGPGFQLGFPTIEPKFFDSIVGVNAYLLIMPTGARIEARQVGTSNIYESADSSYIQVVDNGSAGLQARTPNGAQLSYQLISGEYRCVQVTDRNGNFITANYNSFGHISSIVDTLGRTISFNYDSSQLNMLQSITQIWNGAQHTWASFSYGTPGPVILQTNFTSLTLVGAQNGQNINALTQVTLADASYFTFQYTSWGQVFKITRFAADNHELSHVSYDLPATASVAQSDCPRFTQRHDSAENWNGGAEAITSFVFDPASLTGGQMTVPDGTQYKESYGTSTWQRGLTIQTQVISRGVVKKTTATTYTQDDTNQVFKLNPRPIESNITDDVGNRRRTTTAYNTFPLPSGVSCRLPSDLYEYAVDASTVIRHTHTDYNMGTAYLNSRILGLPATVSVFDGNNVLASQIGYQYDAGVQNQASVVQHDDTNFGAGFITGRGNLTSVQRFNALNTSQFLQSNMAYNTAGDLISSTDPAGHQTLLGYADSFSVGTAPGQTLAYPTSLTNPDGFVSSTQYNYDTGAVTLTQDPKGAQQIYSYDSAGRISQQTYHDSVNGVDGTNTTYAYPAGLNQVQISTLLDPGLVSTATKFLDGAGRLRQAMRNFPGGVGGFSTQLFQYDNMGRLTGQSNPTETDGNGNPTGDDAAGFIFSIQQYDWAGRPTAHTNQDGSISQMSYTGCGCAGGLVEVATDEVGRQSRTTQDVLGRPVKSETLNLDGTVYETTTSTFNTLDQVTSTVEQQGSSGVAETTTMGYDGFGRVVTEHRPEQKPDKSTSYAYYADDLLQSVTDARGAVQNFVYNGRGLATQISYTKPDGNPAAGLTATFGYDAAENRVSLSDALGTVTYSYDTWSRLQNETRSFSDIPSGSYSLAYTYNLAGQLTSVTDPFNSTVSYSYDSAGQLTNIIGSGKHSVPVYVSNMQYRAWGDPKKIVYGNGASETYGYTNSLQVSAFQVFDPNAANFMGGTIGYFSDGNFHTIQDIDRAFDHSFSYDQVGRISNALSGQDAGLGSTVVGPYSEQYGYDVWDNMISRSELLWNGDAFSGDYSTTYTNNRNAAWTYDQEGNPTATETTQLGYDAADREVSSTDPNRTIGSTRVALTLTQTFDGDSQMLKQTNNGTVTYFVRSTVLGGRTVSELASDGTRSAGFVYSSLGALVMRILGGTPNWVHINPVTGSEGRTQQTGAGFRANEFDPLGNDVGLVDPLPGPIGDDTSPDLLYPRGGDPTDLSGGCLIDGMAAPCSLANSLLQSGAGVVGPLSTIAAIYDPNQGKYVGFAQWDPNAAEAGTGILGAVGWVPLEDRFVGDGYVTPWGKLPFDVAPDVGRLFGGVASLEQKPTEYISVMPLPDPGYYAMAPRRRRHRDRKKAAPVTSNVADLTITGGMFILPGVGPVGVTGGGRIMWTHNGEVNKLIWEREDCEKELTEKIDEARDEILGPNGSKVEEYALWGGVIGGVGGGILGAFGGPEAIPPLAWIGISAGTGAGVGAAGAAMPAFLDFKNKKKALIRQYDCQGKFMRGMAQLPTTMSSR